MKKMQGETRKERKEQRQEQIQGRLVALQSRRRRRTQWPR